MNTATAATSGSAQVLPARRFIRAKSGLASRHATDIALQAVAVLMTVLALIPLVWIVGYVIYQGGKSINLELFTEMPRPAGMLGGGVLHSIQGTIILTLLASAFAIPPEYSPHSMWCIGLTLRLVWQCALPPMCSQVCHRS